MPTSQTPSDVPSSPAARFPAVLTEEQRALLAEERRLLEDLRAALARHQGSREADATLAGALVQLDRLFLVVVAGEFNSGKSAVINALVGEGVLEEGVTPTTDRITLLQHPHNVRAGQEGPGAEPVEAGVARLTAEAEVLRHVDVVDTPGTNAVLREHEAVTRDFIPRADLVLFVTSADRPFSESEREFLTAIRDWGKKVAVVINKVDIVLKDEDVQRIQEFVAEHAEGLLGFPPPVFPVSALEARRAAEAEDPDAARELRRRGRLGALEAYVVQTLDEAERVRIKLLSPLQVGRRLAGEQLRLADEQEALLADDFQALSDIEEQLTLYREDMSRQYRFRRTDVENVLGEFERRGLEYFEETVRLGRVFDLANRSKIKGEFERRVVADLAREIEKRVSELIDWLVERDLQQWEAVREHVARRRSEHAERVVGREGRTFDRDRQRLLESIGRTAQRTVESYDREREADRLAESVQRAVAETALLEVGAVGLGATVAAVASSTAADVTGFLTAGVLFTLGLFVLPARKRKAQRELKEKIEALRAKLLDSLDRQFEREIDKGVERIREAVSPYTRFVRSERKKLDEMRDAVGGVHRRLGELAEEIRALE